MSTGKRLAKRSILGTRVAAPISDGLYMTGIIQAVKTCEDPSLVNRFSVKFDDLNSKAEFLETDLVGPGFKPVTSIKLEAGQLVYVTHMQREMAGRVVRHDFDSQDVIITLNDGDCETLLKKIDEVRLLESRKSARLINSDTDFSKLADLNISQSNVTAEARKAISKAIEVPQHRSDYVQISGSRKRRTSETLIDDEETMTECSAAMLLMKLSCSPGSNPAMAAAMLLTNFENGINGHSGSLPSYPNMPSPVDSSGASSFRSATPSPPLSSSTGTSTADEGIVKDLFSTDQMQGSRSTHYKPKVVYQCTYPGCKIAAVKSIRAIEAHVRREHLGRADDHPDDGEEEFYYTEVEIPSTAPRVRAYTEPASQMANLSLADHLDMARPAHEDPGFPVSSSTLLAASGFRNKIRSFSGNSNKSSLLINQYHHHHHGQHGASGGGLGSGGPASLTTPITIAPSMGSPGKYILISPPGNGSGGHTGNGDTISCSAPTSGGHSMLKSPGHRRIREGKKCRKVYGLEQRDLWCTQCKWKKACARFAKPSSAASAASGSLLTQAGSASHETSATSLLIPAGPAGNGIGAPGGTASNAVRAIKF